jgi:hypothetical protein
MAIAERLLPHTVNLPEDGDADAEGRRPGPSRVVGRDTTEDERVARFHVPAVRIGGEVRGDREGRTP